VSHAPITIQEFPAWLNRLAASVETPHAEGVFKPWLERFMGEIGAGFQSSVSQFGEAWAPLKYPRPPGHNPDTRPLIDTGDLMRSVTSNAAGNINKIGPAGLTFGTSIPYAHVHQAGSFPIPARPFLNVNQDQATRAAEMIAQQIIKLLK